MMRVMISPRVISNNKGNKNSVIAEWDVSWPYLTAVNSRLLGKIMCWEYSGQIHRLHGPENTRKTGAVETSHPAVSGSVLSYGGLDIFACFRSYFSWEGLFVARQKVPNRETWRTIIRPDYPGKISDLRDKKENTRTSLQD